MKTYNLFYASMAVLTFISCSKSDGDSLGDNEEEKSIQADYSLIVTNNGNLSGELFNVDNDALTMSTETSEFNTISVPDLSFEENSVFTVYHNKTDCSGEISVHNFDDSTNNTYKVFMDLGACNLTPKAILHKEGKIYIAYELQTSATLNEYYVREIDMVTSKFVDVSLDKRPLELAYANSRLFVLGIDDENTDENTISVINTTSNTVIHSQLVGSDVRRIFTSPDDDIIISYDKLHSMLNSTTLSIAYTNYSDGSEPNFAKSPNFHFDGSGKMYYEMTPTEFSDISAIPAIYDFALNLTVLYAYENFMTETQLNFEYQVEETTIVSYDEENDLLLVGYKKTSGDNKGGLLLIKPAPEPKLLYSIDVEGIPTSIFID